MCNQTPPAVTEGQYAKLVDVARGFVRKGEITGPEFQHILGHRDFAPQIGAVFTNLATEHRLSLPLIERPPFLTAKVGTLETEADFRRALMETNPVCKVSPWASDIMGKPDFAASIPRVKEEVEFVYASNKELDYQDGCTRLEAYEAGLRLGWKLCLASDGPEIRRHYLNQPIGERLMVAMELITDSAGRLRVFDVERYNDGLWLGSYNDYPNSVWSADHRWVFRLK